MGKTAKVEKSDGIEIISIGKLFTGPWDKKYWSSSRGKDRYPYPVGYKSVRNQNGVTYTMEILEGLKGPSFVISSTDGKSCSGDTPDMAWESFQKKGYSKLWHGKRFSCKIDGVEFFGFKNTFVQRLLRELVANVGGTAEQSFLPSSVSSECKSSSPDPDLLTYLVKSHVQGKRMRNDKVVANKRLNRTHVNQHQQNNCTKNASSSNSKQRDQPNCGSGGSSTFAAANEASGYSYSPGLLGPENSATIVMNHKCLPIAERSKLYSLDVSSELKLGSSLSHEERGVTTPINHFEPSGSPRCDEVQGFNNLILEERDGVSNYKHGSPVASDADLFAPNTLDHAVDSSSVYSVKNVQVHMIAEDATVSVAKSEVLVTDSLPENEIGITACSTGSEKCDNNSASQDIAKSMMTVLLPRAVPLLKTFTRKKKKSPKPTHRSQEENNMPNISMNDAIMDGNLAEHSDLERKNRKACIPCPRHDSVVSTSGNSDTVVPDSFENDVPQDPFPHADAAKAGQFSCGLNLSAQLPINVNAEVNTRLCHSEIREHGENLHNERQTALSDKPKRETGTSDAALLATPDTLLGPVKEIIANSKQAKFDCPSVDKLTPPIHVSKIEEASRSESVCRSSPHTCMPEIPSTSCCVMTENNLMNDDSRLNIQQKAEYSRLNDDSRLNIQQKEKFNSKLGGLLKLFGCYVHPMPISMVQLIVRENEIFICVKCGYTEHKEGTLFLYKAIENGEKMGSPSLIGHVPIAFQIPKDVLGRDISTERSLLQLTPVAQSVVLLNSIKTPCCREGKLHCSCRVCTSDCCEKNAVKIVRLKRGYASLVNRLETTQSVCCLLVCEPSFLLAAEEGGKLKLWVMNSEWSEQKEDWYLPTFDWRYPIIVELKTIPKSAILVIGHNGIGEFGLWDIDKRNLVSRFSSPGMSVLECSPTSFFRWQRKGEHNTRSIINEIMDATKASFSATNENHIYSPEDNDVAVWLLISTDSDPDSQCDQSCEQEKNPVRYWRLALLVNNVVITGSVVDEGVTAVTSGGHGVVGRCDGLVYLWELSTGVKLGNLHSFNGSRVSYITTDTSNSGALAIASAGELLVYLPS